VALLGFGIHLCASIGRGSVSGVAGSTGSGSNARRPEIGLSGGQAVGRSLIGGKISVVAELFARLARCVIGFVAS
jgi:hypothetical protein